MEDKRLIWVVFYGLSALGKTHWLGSVEEAFKQNSIFCQVVSSDDCSKKIIDGLLAKNPALSRQQAFDQSRKQAAKLFEASVGKAVAALKSGNNVIVLDKVMNSDKFLAGINKCFGVSCTSRLVAVVPKSEGPFYFSKSFVPFSFLLIANVCHRIVSRKTHQTIDGSDEKKLFLGLSFVKLYNNVKSFAEKQEAAGIDEFLEVSFHKEDPLAGEAIPADFLALLKSTLRQVRPFQGDEGVCADLAAYLQSESFKPVLAVLGFGETAQQEERVKEIIGMFHKM